MRCRLKMMTQTKHLRRETQNGDVSLCCFMRTGEKGGIYAPPEYRVDRASVVLNENI